MSLPSLSALAKYRATPFPTGYPVEDHITLYSPEDNIPAALKLMIGSAEHSLIIAMYGFDDDGVAEMILSKMNEEDVYVQLSLDSTQAAGKHESALLQRMAYDSNSVAFGQSERHRIMHLKHVVIDGVDVIGGSTNWSSDGETRQDNEFTVTRHPLIAATARTKIDLIHSSMLTQMAGKHP